MEFEYDPEPWITERRRSFAAAACHGVRRAAVIGAELFLPIFGVLSIVDWPQTRPPMGAPIVAAQPIPDASM